MQVQDQSRATLARSSMSMVSRQCVHYKASPGYEFTECVFSLFLSLVILSQSSTSTPTSSFPVELLLLAWAFFCLVIPCASLFVLQLSLMVFPLIPIFPRIHSICISEICFTEWVGRQWNRWSLLRNYFCSSSNATRRRIRSNEKETRQPCQHDQGNAVLHLIVTMLMLQACRILWLSRRCSLASDTFWFVFKTGLNFWIECFPPCLHKMQT